MVRLRRPKTSENQALVANNWEIMMGNGTTSPACRLSGKGERKLGRETGDSRLIALMPEAVEQ